MKNKILLKSEEQDVFTDLLFNALLGFAFMFAVAFMLINSSKEEGNVESKAEILITMRWQDSHPDDVDAVVEDPRGGIVWYHNRDSGLMHLDRDDRGNLADKLNLSGKIISNPINQETVSIRSLMSGEYVINILHYKSNFRDPLPVTVKVEKLNPTVKLLHYGEYLMTGIGDERTALRFTVDGDKNITNFNQIPKTLLTKALSK